MRPKAQADGRKLAEFLAQVSAVEFLGFADDVAQQRHPQALFDPINRYDAQETSKRSIHTPEAARNEWIMVLLEALHLESECYVWFLGLSQGWRWASIKILDRSNWLASLLGQYEADENELEDFMILSANRKAMLGIIVEEWDYLAFVRALEEA